MGANSKAELAKYRKIYKQSSQKPEVFWGKIAQGIKWHKPPTEILSRDENGVSRWFADGELNTAYLALDYHVESGRGDQPALIWDSPSAGSQRTYTYSQLTDVVARAAGALQTLGVGKGDRVAIYMPAVPEAVIAMLACARLGAVHSVVFGGFAPSELAARINDASPKVLITATCGIEFGRVIPYLPLVREAIDLSSEQFRPEVTVVLGREQCHSALEQKERDWDTLVGLAKPVDPVPVKATDPLYILYTSGTTGKPKGVVRDNGGHAVALRYSMDWVYDCKPGEIFWAASDVGWVVGHSYIVYAPLLSGCTTIMYEGKPVRTPDAGAFWRVCSEHRVNYLFAAPTAFRAIKKEDPEGKLALTYDLSQLKTIFVAGERLDPPTLDWTTEILQKPVIDHWWQTETGWSIVCPPRGDIKISPKPGSSGIAVPGYVIDVLDDNGNKLGANQQGYLAIKLPLPPSCLPTIWRDHARYEQSYLEQFPGYYVTGDGGYIDKDGYVFIMGRVDDVINVAGHRLSTGEMEEIVCEHPAVAECAVFGVSDELRGEVPLGLIVLKDGETISHEAIKQELVDLVRARIGAIACFREAFVTGKLPKTRSGKILRRSLRQIANGERYDVPSTIEDPGVLSEIAKLLENWRGS